jgi:hypothetical protein
VSTVRVCRSPLRFQTSRRSAARVWSRPTLFAEIELHQLEDVPLVFDDQDELLSRHARLVYRMPVATT